MIVVEESVAEYFDDCSDCGEVMGYDYMINIVVGYDSLRLCKGCFLDLFKKMSKQL